MLVQLAFDRALALESQVSDRVLSLQSISGKCYRMFINNLVRLVSKPRYLEVGSWAGSTACAAIHNNGVTALCIDNWSEFGGPKDIFAANIASVTTSQTNLRFIGSEFREAKIGAMGRFNIYRFDGPHEEKDQYDALYMYDPALDTTVISYPNYRGFGSVIASPSDSYLFASQGLPSRTG